MKLYFFPLSPYSQKALIALEEKGAHYEKIFVNLGDAAAHAEYEKVNPFGKVPFLRDDQREWSVPESSSIIEYVDRHVSGGTSLVPSDPDLARQARFYDRVFDLYVTEQALKIFFDGQRPAEKRDAHGVEQAQKRIDKTYALLDQHLAKKTWVLGDTFSMGDVSGAAALRMGAHARPWSEHKSIAAYFQRLSQRPAVASAFKQADEAFAQRARR
jgi:glutathione S-transferase